MDIERSDLSHAQKWSASLSRRGRWPPRASRQLEVSMPGSGSRPIDSHTFTETLVDESGAIAHHERGTSLGAAGFLVKGRGLPEIHTR